MSTHRRLTLAVLVAAAAAGACQERIVNIVEVASVDITGASSTLLPGGTMQLSATPRDDRNNALTNRSITWASSNTAVATVSGTGLVEAKGAGSATISAQAENRSGSVSIAVNNPVPSVGSVAPNSITVGSPTLQLTVTGSSFVPTSVVLWSGQERQTQYLGPTSLRATIAAADLAATGSFNVSVRNPAPGGGFSATSAVTVVNPVPAVSAVAPAVAIVGTAFELTVTGSGFVAGSVVLWNGQERQTQFVNATTLRAAITAADVAATGSFSVTVRNSPPGGGTSGGRTVSVEYPVPQISTLAPALAIVGSAAFELTVTGSGFVPGSVVQWNGQDRNTQYIDATRLAASIAAADVAAAGSFNVVVRNPQPGGGTSAAKAFAVNNPVPVLTGLSPTSMLWTDGPIVGAQLTVTGTGFVQGAVIRLNGQDRTTQFLGATSLRALLSSADLNKPALIDVTVVNPAPGGGTSSASQFTVRIDPPGPTVSSRMYATCAVRGNGEAYCWGQNSAGQLGDGTTTDRTAPTRVATTIPFVSIVVGLYHACGLTSWGAAYCWGQTAIGNGGWGSDTPVQVSGGHAFIQLAAGGYHSCGVTSAGGLYCWGDNWRGQLGDGSTTMRLVPVAVGTAQTWRRAIGGYSHSCAINAAGRMYCWGANWSGQLGDNSTTDRLVPTQISGSTLFAAGAAGNNHTCGISTGGAAWCWGGGILGNGTWNSSTTPVAVSGGQLYRSMSAATNHTCAVTQGGAAWCWGYGGIGQLGTGFTDSAPAPVAVNMPAARDIAAAELHSCALTTSGTVYCWGARSYGSLGDGVSGVRYSPTAVSGAGSGYLGVSAGLSFSCGLRGTTARCWGMNNNGQLGDYTYMDHPVPTTVGGGLAFSQVSTGGYHACGLVTDGRAFCWGANWYGQLGDGTTNTANGPVAVSGGYRFTSIRTGGSHTCGITTAGEVRCWGENRYGQLGDGTTTARSVPTAIVGVAGHTFSRVASGASGDHMCAVTTSGRLFCWGSNTDGELGNGTTTSSLTPVLLPLTGVASVSAAAHHTCALITTGAAYCWGYNGVGELGNGSSSGEPSLSPVAVAGGRAYGSITAGFQATCAVATDGIAYCWGLNHWGQLGIGTRSYPSVPTAVAGGASYGSVVIGSDHACGLTNGGAVHCWGSNQRGQLGIGIPGYQPVPTEVAGGLVFSEVSCPEGNCAVALLSPSARRLFAPASGGWRGPVPRLEPARPQPACDPLAGPCRLEPVRIVR